MITIFALWFCAGPEMCERMAGPFQTYQECQTTLIEYRQKWPGRYPETSGYGYRCLQKTVPLPWHE
jgi:hypothetical protein